MSAQNFDPMPKEIMFKLYLLGTMFRINTKAKNPMKIEAIGFNPIDREITLTLKLYRKVVEGSKVHTWLVKIFKDFNLSGNHVSFTYPIIY